MNFDNFPRTNWITYLTENRPPISFPSANEKKSLLNELLEKARSLLESGKIGLAIDQVDLGLYIDKKYFFDKIKRKGILRHSKYLGGKNPVPGIAQHLLLQKDFFGFTQTEESYLTSLIHFKAFYSELKEIHKFITSELHKFKIPNVLKVGNAKYATSRIKALLARADVNFLTDPPSNRLSEDLTNFTFYSKEEIAEAVSFLVSKYNEQNGITIKDLKVIDSAYSVSDACTKLILEACRYKAFVSLEIEIEEYGFTCNKIEGKTLINHPDQNFIKSIELANIQYGLQFMANFVHLMMNNKDAASLSDLCIDYHRRLPNYFERKEEPIPRYILHVDTRLYQFFLNKDETSFFREELSMMHAISRELLIPYEKLDTYELRPGFTFSNFIRLFRVFIFQYHLNGSPLLNLISENEDDKIILNSVLAAFSKEDMIEMLARISTPEKAAIFLEMISWNTQNKHQFLDLQYTPIIENEGNLLICTNIAGISKLPRSIFLSESRSGNNIKTTQMENHLTIGNILTQAFRSQGFITDTEVPVKYKSTNQKESDIDFLAYKDGILFIAECKDPLYPTDLFEMRTTFDYTKKAVTQLNYILEAIKDPTYLHSLCQRLKIADTEIRHVAPAIVLSNNKFYGYSIDGIPIRNFKELASFLLTGNWDFSMFDDKVTRFKLWQSDRFNVNDLLAFLSENSPHRAMFDACNPKRFKYGNKLYKKTYSLLPENVKINLKQKYTFVMEEIHS